MADHRPGTHRGGASKSAQIGRTGYREPLRGTARRGGTHADRTDRAEAPRRLGCGSTVRHSGTFAMSKWPPGGLFAVTEVTHEPVPPSTSLRCSFPKSKRHAVQFEMAHCTVPCSTLQRTDRTRNTTSRLKRRTNATSRGTPKTLPPASPF